MTQCSVVFILEKEQFRKVKALLIMLFSCILLFWYVIKKQVELKNQSKAEIHRKLYVCWNLLKLSKLRYTYLINLSFVYQLSVEKKLIKKAQPSSNSNTLKFIWNKGSELIVLHKMHGQNQIERKNILKIWMKMIV